MKDQSSNRDADRIRELLDKAAPRNPDTVGRADAVSARGRRTRVARGAAGGLAVAAAAAAVIVVPHLMGSSPTTNEATDPSNGVKTVAQADLPNPFTTAPCPAKPVDVNAADPGAPPNIEPVATAIRLCTATFEGAGSTTWRPPADALVTGIDGFLNDLAAVEPADPARCAALRPVPDPYAFTVTLDSGKVEPIVVSTACSDISVDGRMLESGAVLEAFTQALASQRAEFEPAGVTPPEVDCAAAGEGSVATTRGSALATDTTFVSFTYCFDGKTDRASGEGTGLLNEEWSAGALDLAANEPTDIDTCPGVDVAYGQGFAVTEWGDMVQFWLHGCGNYIVKGYDPVNGAANAFQLVPSQQLLDALSLI